MHATVCSISAQGQVNPCSFLGPNLDAGNLRDHAFQDIWDASHEFRALRDPTLDRSRGGVERNSACGGFEGGCRARAQAMSGSVHAADANAAIQAARDVYTRRSEGVSIWVVPSSQIHASDPHETDAWFEGDHPYRHPTFYDIPEEVGHM